MTIQPIETHYRGFAFRSRAEARWAVFLDTLGVRFQYEPEGFLLPPIVGDGESVAYLPDFLVPKQIGFPDGLWIEVKGIETNGAWSKVARLAVHTRLRAVMLPADIPLPEDVSGDWSFELCEMELTCAFPSGDCDNRYCFCECPSCHAIGFEFDGRAERISCACKGSGKILRNASPRLMRAYSAARSARFEHGQHGAAA